MLSVSPLRPGSHLRVVAPSSPFVPEELERGAARLRARYRVTYDPGILDRTGLFAGADARRARELLAAFTDPDVDAIVAARGGYGATRLLSRLDPEVPRAHPKLLVGLSDLTAVHAWLARAGLRSIHGAMVTALGRAADDALPDWCAIAEGRAAPVTLEGAPLSAGVARGPLVGGNLSILAALVGTPYAPPIDGAILLLEDVGEAPYRVDRMLETLDAAGWLARIAGLALGSFEGCAPRADGVTIDDVLRERFAAGPLPAVRGLPVGHHRDDRAVVLGAAVTIDGTSGAFVAHEGVSGVPGTASKKA